MNLDYKKIFKELNKTKVDYLVVGGLAVNFHGIPRMTYDLDLMLLLESGNILKMVAKLSKWGYRPRAPVDPRDLADDTVRESWIVEKGLKAFSFSSPTSPIGEIDLVVETPIPYDQLKTRAMIITLEDEGIPVIALDDLITIKKVAGRQQDLMDIEHLQRIRKK